MSTKLRFNELQIGNKSNIQFKVFINFLINLSCTSSEALTLAVP